MHTSKKYWVISYWNLKFQADLTPPIMSDVLVTRKSNYNFRSFQELESSLIRTVKFGTKTISYRGLQIWNLISERLRALATLNKFKKELKNRSVMPLHVECATRTLNVLASLTKNCNVFSLGHRYSKYHLFFHFYWQKLLTKNPYYWYYFTLVIIWVVLVNVFYRIARFVICNYLKGEGVDFD